MHIGGSYYISGWELTRPCRTQDVTLRTLPALFMNMGKNLTKDCNWWTIELCREPFVFVVLFKSSPKAGINRGNLCLLKAI